MDVLKEKLGVQIFLNFDFRGFDLVDKVSQFIQNVADMLSDVITLLHEYGKYDAYRDELERLENTLYDAMEHLVKASVSGKASDLSNAWLLSHQVLRDLKKIMAKENLVKVDYELVKLDEWVGSFVRSKLGGGKVGAH
ncbi:MAG: hypothetical protein H0Z19_05275 [Archaeoglobus sp.]|uniref:hypothetical protein n=1 Tax=Archaeoglobus sp. TaxID=1872626 RepID=UPI001D98816E|nr:hypothetical protein [Archaeoglobus sp.]MBO8179879.1 hypothetical protein [Archaeoglobus sp.]